MAPLIVANPTAKDIARFWAKVKKGKPNECWLWIAGCTQWGYGNFYFQGRWWGAAKFSYTISKGEIPEGDYEIMHNCPGGDNRRCVNPTHLLVGTPAQHAKDKENKKQWRPARGERHTSAKMTIAKVKRMRNLRKKYHWSYTYLAKKFGISMELACDICNHERWKHVP